MPQAVVAAAAAAGSTLVTGGALAAAGVAAGQAFMGSVIALGIGEVVGAMNRPKRPAANGMRGTQMAFRAPDAPREHVYGEVRKAGVLVFMGSSGDNDEYLHAVYVLAAHEVESIGEAEFDGQPERALLHHNARHTVTVTWQRYYHPRDVYPEWPDHYWVVLDGETLGASSVAGLAAKVNALGGYTAVAEFKESLNEQRRTLQISTNEDGPTRIVVTTQNPDFARQHRASLSVVSNNPEYDAFRIWRHLGAPNQAADAELVRLFANGRRARVAVRWAEYLANKQLSLQGRQLVGSVSELVQEIAQRVPEIEARAQGDSGLVLEHKTPGVAIDVSSIDPGFSREQLQTQAAEWSPQHQLRGLAYVHIRYARRSEVWGNNAPNPTFLVRGKKLYDPRTEVMAWSDNWALAVRDALGWSLNVPSHRLDDPAFAQAATVCDEPVTLDHEGRSQRRYTVNGVLRENESTAQILGMLRQHGGWIVRRRGIWHVQPWVPQLPVPGLGEADAITRPEVTLGHERMDLYNSVRPTFVGPESHWEESPAPEVTSAFYRNQDGNQPLYAEPSYRLASDALRAQRLAKIQLEMHRQQIRVVWTVLPTRLDVQVGHVVPITLPRLGWHEKLFFVENAEAQSLDAADLSTAEPGEGGGVTLALSEYAGEMFDWNYGQATNVDLAPNSSLRRQYLEAPLQVVVTCTPAWYTEYSNQLQLAQAHVAWMPGRGDVMDYEVQWQPVDSPSWRSAPPVPGSETVIGPLSDAVDVRVRVRARDYSGKRSAWAVSEPAAVQSVYALTGGDGEIRITRASKTAAAAAAE